MFIKDSQNAKIAGKHKVCATYMPIKQTCPDTCALKDSGCYAQQSFVGMHNKRLEAKSDGLGPVQLAIIEAKEIDEAFLDGVPQDGPNGGGRPLRIHVSGDCRIPRAARIVAAAAERYMNERSGGQAWSYTHAWRTVPRSAWKSVSVLASVDSIKEAYEAKRMGYAPAIVVPEHKDTKLYRIGNSKFIPCPAQTRDHISCTDCKLCLNADGLVARNQGIAFAAHGTKTNVIKKRLNVIK